MTFTQAIRELDLRHPISQRPLSSQELINFLKEDVVLAARRPGCWEASNMMQILLCHGFIEKKYY
ncbi:MAG: hypothetical protein GY710_14120 [Desulfobacteraceae bacterium]|nr:hypothetical protein [Desulfobacteraceae bacterium]